METPHKSIIGAIVLIVVFFLGYGAGNYPTDNKNGVSIERLNSSEYHFINPLLDFVEDEKRALLNSELADLNQKIEAITKSYIERGLITQGSVYYRDLNNGPWFLVGDEYQYTAASLFKVPVMIAYYKEAEKDPTILERQVTYSQAFADAPLHNMDGSNETIVLGNTYTVAELIERMIIYSDNLSAYLLVENINPEIVVQVFKDLNVPLVQGAIMNEPFGPRTYAGFLRILYNGTYLNKFYSEKALEVLSRSTYSHGMRTALLPDTKASIKYGVAVDPDGKKQLHECGIVYWEDRLPHLLCVMTLGNDFNAEALYTQEVTRAVQASILKK